MTPRIIPGELVIIDPEHGGVPESGGEWAFNIDGQLTIGVARWTPRGLMLSFYNREPGWEPVNIGSDLALGKILASIPAP
jgi:hypothetical protein